MPFFYINTDKKLKSVIIIIMEKAECNLLTYLSKIPKPIPQPQVINMLSQISLGIKYLHHELEITHRNLKPENILFMKDNVFVITDFEISKHSLNSSMTIKSQEDILYEVHEDSEMERRQKLLYLKEDIYSLGLIACIIMTTSQPSKNEINERSINFLDGFTNELIDLVYEMLSLSPWLRPSIEQILAHSLLDLELKS